MVDKVYVYHPTACSPNLIQKVENFPAFLKKFKFLFQNSESETSKDLRFHYVGVNSNKNFEPQIVNNSIHISVLFVDR